MYKKTPLGRFGFSLVELLVVVGIIALIAAVAFPNLIALLKKGKTDATKAQIGGITLAIESYKTDLGSYPPKFTWLEAMQEGLGKSTKWRGPYIKGLESNSLAWTDAQGQAIETKAQGPLGFYDGGVITNYVPANSEVILDAFDRPLIYIPFRNYSSGAANFIDSNANETTFYNPDSFQLISFGLDGFSIGTNPGGLLFDDNVDNDGDGLNDLNDNIESSGDVTAEDDVANF